MKFSIYLFVLLFIISSCSPRIITPLSESEKVEYQTQEIEEIEEISNNLEGLAHARLNKKREKYVRKTLYSINSNVRKERIDIYSFQHNYIMEIKGETEKIIYITAHYDKTDMNIFKMFSLFCNGLLDEPFSFTFLSQGAIDNGTGVVTALQLASKLCTQSNYYTYRILLSGSEESGIRGSRAHVAKIPINKWQHVKCCINIDCIGVKNERLAIINNDCDPHLLRLSIETAKEKEIDLVLIAGTLGMSDNTPFNKTNFALDFGRSLLFNLPGAFLPQRSYFTKEKTAPTIFFSSTEVLNSSFINLFNPLLPIAIPSGSIHSYSDNLSKIDIMQLYEGYRLIDGLIMKIEEMRLY
jgi:hypothetical protein